MKEQANVKNSPFACDMSSLTDPERNRHIAVIKEVFGAVKSIRELSDGYAFCLAANDHLLIKATEFIIKERLCCPFFSFELSIEPDVDFWLSLTGSEGIKPFIRAEIGGALDDSVARKAGFTDK